jgi:hypothetical protein
MSSRNTSVTVTRLGFANAKIRAKKLGLPVATVLAEAIEKYPVSKKTIEIVRELRSKQVALARTAAEELDKKIEKAGGGDKVTRSEVLDFILQQGLDNVKGTD